VEFLAQLRSDADVLGIRCGIAGAQNFACRAIKIVPP